MSTLKQRQQQMMAWLHGTNEEICPHIVDQGNLSSLQRLSIYRTGWRIRLAETIDTDHPALGTYLGDTLYSEMLDGYLAQYPSTSTSLRQFADNLPVFLAEQPPFSQHPQIAELARFERLLLTAFDAADSPRATMQNLMDTPSDQWPALHFTFHPSLQIFTANHNVVQIWQALKAEQAPPELQQGRQDWLVWRNAERLTEFVALSPLEESLLRSLLRGAPLAEAAELIAQEIPEQEAGSYLLSTLNKWFELGCIQALNRQVQLNPV